MPVPLPHDDPSELPDGEGEERENVAPAPVGPLYQAGDIIAQKYRLSRMIGAGGMGTVWLARNIKLDVDVAIKLIRHELGTSEASHRLLQEARAAARIGHRSIVRVFDFGETELDDPFIVMEVLTGESLRELLDRKGRLPAANAVRTILPIASALVEAHASGIVHRDLKPENVMLVPDKSGGAVPKLLDFGIAKFVRTDGGADDTGRTRLVTGTPDYMSPEQAGGDFEVGERADVWALAVMLYEAITGRVPFSGPNYTALVFAIMTADAIATHEQMAGDAELWEILRGALSKRDVERPSMRELGTQLARWALARGLDSDIAGTSLAVHWLHDATQGPFSEAPPGVVSDLAIPRPGAMPAGLKIPLPTEAPPRAPFDADAEPIAPLGVPQRGRGTVWIGVAIVAAGALATLALRARSAPPPTSITTVKSAPIERQSIAPIAPIAPIATSATADPIATAPIATASPAIVETAIAPRAPETRPAATMKAPPNAKKPSRRGDLPIAKQPNF